MISSRLLNELSAELPTATLLLTYKAGIPVCELELEVRLLAKQRMSSVQEYTMRCIALGARTLGQVDFALGLGARLTRATLAYLQSYDLISPIEPTRRGELEFELTERGRVAIAEVAVRRPVVLSLPCLFEGMLGKLRARRNRVRHAGKGSAASQAIHAIPSHYDTPTADVIDKRDVQLVIRDLRRADPAKLPEGEVLDVVSISSASEKYRIVDVAVFQDPDEQLTFRVVDRGVRLKEFEQRLAEMSKDNIEVLPLEDASNSSRAKPAEPWLEKHELDVARENAEYLTALEERVELIEQASHAMPVDPAAPGAATTREQLESTKAELARLKADVEKGVVYIDTEEHRRLLERAFRHAKELVVVVSPWLTRSGVDEEFECWVADALWRGVNVSIGWGYPDEGNADYKRKREQSLRTAERLNARADASFSRKRRNAEPPAEQRGKLRIVELGDTHAKLLVADLNFAVVTSFNWLSFGGKKLQTQKVLRRENGTRIGLPERVKEIRDRTLALMDAAEAAEAVATK